MSRRKLVAKKLSELQSIYGWGFQRRIAESIDSITLNQIKAVFANRVANDDIVNKVFAKAVELCEDKLKSEEKELSELAEIISQTEYIKEKILPDFDNNSNNIFQKPIDVVKKHLY